MTLTLTALATLLSIIALDKRPWNSPSMGLTILDLFRNTLFIYCALRWTQRAFWKIRSRGPIGAVLEFYSEIRRIIYGYILRVPSVRGQVREQLGDALSKLSAKLIPVNQPRHLSLPEHGLDEDDVLAELDKLAKLDHVNWEEGYVSGAVYHGEKDLIRLQSEAFAKFIVTNPIHPDVFPGVRKMEAEVVAMVLDIFNAPPGAAGVCTSGGTESILVACLAARQKGAAERGISEPEMIMAETAHPAFRKAADYFKIKLHTVASPAPSYQVDVKAVGRLINSNTVMLVGSAPNFPHGIIDDISALSKLALQSKLWLHVDCCLGSFLVPFLEKAGFKTQPFDFRLEGVSSISCDTHKYGFAPKGNSTCLYRSAELRKYQYYVCPDWSGGVYASPGMAGSRPGALIAGCWASLMSLGNSGYLDSCIRIVGTTKQIVCAIQRVPELNSELEILGNPLVSVVAFKARNLNTYHIVDAMTEKGWHLNALQNPPAIHVAVTIPITKVWERLIDDLQQVVSEEVEKERARAKAGIKKEPTSDTAVLYGLAGSLPNKSVLVDLTNGFLDLLYKA